MLLELNHQELNLLLFSLEGAPLALTADSVAEPSCEDACPVVDHLGEMFGAMTPEKKLVNHLNNHLREGMLECGFLEVADKLRSGDPAQLSPEDQAKFQQANERLLGWRCAINFDEGERRHLREAFARLPRSAWLVMPRTLWRLRKKLRAG